MDASGAVMSPKDRKLRCWSAMDFLTSKFAVEYKANSRAECFACQRFDCGG
jgi:hypothetical protein